MIKLDKKMLDRTYGSFINYTGGKHRYIEDLFRVLPEKDGLNVLDPFVGGGCLVNKLPDSWQITCSDICDPLINLHKAVQAKSFDTDSLLAEVKRRGLSNHNEEAYYKLRDDYNKEPNEALFYLLLCHSNSNMLRFGPKGFNTPFGKRTFNKNMQQKLINYQRSLQQKNVTFDSRCFSGYDFSNYDLLLIDTPYSDTLATYNERGGWSKAQELSVYEKISNAHQTGAGFALFGQVKAKGVENSDLKCFADQYEYKVLKETTRHCNYQRKDLETIEIMVWG